MSVSCESCTSPRVTRISITMTEGDVVDFTSCHRCEHKTYATGGRPLPLERVMSMAGRKK
ncbi:MAG: hypothetical protein QOE45_1026 [Frankiaceae bacterium]|jgi:hypothetical protein|nr:hypothetical protein [Frankiaceae bacterium]